LVVKKEEEKLKGDKMRDLILMVYLNNKYDKDKNRIPWLKEKLGYSTGGLYNALDESGYFERTSDGICLTEKGINYLNKQILPQYTAFYSVGNLLITLGFVFLLQWYFWTYTQTPIIIPWHSAIIIIAGGILVRFFFLRLNHLIMKMKKK
jgi:hypothetical protein